MLGYSYYHKDKIQTEFQRLMETNENYLKYWNMGSYISFDFTNDISCSTWEQLSCCSIIDSKVIGTYKCTLNRETKIAYDLSIINFSDKNNYTFSKDLFLYLDKLFSFDIESLEFSMVVGNPIGRMYDKFVKRCNGDIFDNRPRKNNIKLYDGTMSYSKKYIVYKEDYLKYRGLVNE